MLLFPPPLEIGEDEGGTPENDIFKRKGFGESLARLVGRAHDALVTGLDAPWGEGKTTAIRMWKVYLDVTGSPVRAVQCLGKWLCPSLARSSLAIPFALRTERRWASMLISFDSLICSTISSNRTRLISCNT